MSNGGWFSELRRRRVFASAAAYVVIAWALLQVADTLFPIYELPEWTLRLFTTALMIGFPVAIVLSWFFDLRVGRLVRSGDLPLAGGARELSLENLDLPDGPTIAVLPFRDLGAEGSDDYFAEALSGGIISGLIQSSHLSVISSADDSAAQRGTGAEYVLEGTVLKAGQTLRVSGQLRETKTDLQLWSESYDRELSAQNLFAVQDEIRDQIVSVLSDLHGPIYSSKGKQATRRPPEDLSAYECLAVALGYDKYISAEMHLLARDSLERATQIDPGYDEAWAHLSWIYTDEYVWGFNPQPQSMERATAAARRAVQLAPDNYHNHWLLSRVHYFSGELGLFRAEAAKALELNARDATTLGLIGMYTAYSGDWAEGLKLLEKARQLNPNYPGYYHVALATAAYNDARFDEALEQLNRAHLPEFPLTLILLCAVCCQLGDRHGARQHLAALAALGSDPSLDGIRLFLQRTFPFVDDLVERLVADIATAKHD